MKLKNILLNTLALGIVALGLASCESDIDPVYVLPSDGISLEGAKEDIILTPDNTEALAMTIYWNGDGKLALSDTLLQAPVNAAVETIQLSKDEQFSTTIDLSVGKGVRYRQFLSQELNSLLGRLGYTPDEKAPLYIRIRSVLGSNINPTYSSVIKVMVQSYRIHLILGTVLDKDWNETAMQLASPEENGIYQGFMGVNGWTNWWLREANNVVWGNLGQDGKTFYASSDDSHWNFWFPNPAGCYYTTLNTLCQIDGVDSVSFLCGDYPLTNEDGSVVTAMNSDMFIFNSGKEIMNYEKVRLHLYFANEDGDQLVDTYRNVVYNSNISMERLVVEQVLKGPNSDVVFPTLNPAAKVLSVTTRDGVCYVNLDQAFLTEPYGVTSQVAIYSLVNSLTELSSVSAVQITIEGKTGKSFMDSSLSSAFERNLSVVRKNETR